jgi:uncharacterized protein YhdP
LQADLWFESEQTRLQLTWEAEQRPPLRAQIRFEGRQFAHGDLLLGAVESRQEAAPGLYVRADVPALELAPWVEFWSADRPFLSVLPGAPTTAAGDPPARGLRRVELHADRLDAYGQPLSDVGATLTPLEHDWDIRLGGTSVAGQVVLPTPEAPLELRFSHLHLPGADPAASVDPAAQARAREDSDPRRLPSMKVALDDLRVGDTAYGQWQVEVQPIAEGALLHPLQGTLGGARVQGRLEWKKFDQHVHSSLALLDIEGANIAPPLASFGIQDLITSTSFQSEMALHWGDLPQRFDLSRLSGSIRLAMQKGVLKTDDKKTGFLRVFGMLNPQTILRRLQLDFSDLVQSGVSYDTLTVAAGMDQGQMALKEPLIILGPSSNYDIQGNIDMEKRALDLGMIVSLPINENVPLAAIVLGAPVIGGAVWVVDKLLGEPLSSLTTVGYSITGPWSEPKLELQQVINANDRKVLKKMPEKK